MKIGFIGLGKLGLPCAVAMDMKGHEVLGYDADPALMSKAPREYLETGPDGESDFNHYLENSTLTFAPIAEVAKQSDIIFVAVQTPHEEKFEGVTRLPDERRDFDYSYLRRAVGELAEHIVQDTAVAIISTVLPGTIRREILPLTTPLMRICYNPYFIAMGTTMHDFLHPEFVLFGANDQEVLPRVRELYASITDAPIFETTIENAELIKVAYNTFISMKIVFANTLMEICHHTPGTDVDVVSTALCLDKNRIISSKYLYGGMGDGGGCHPRDNIAMSHLAQELPLSHDFFETLMLARERQTEWLANLMEEHELPKAILGYSFKPESNITVGSPALLLKTLLEERGHDVFMHDPLVEGSTIELREPMVFLVGTRHAAFSEYTFPQGSVVIDPWRCISVADEQVTLISIGKLPSP